MPDSHKLRELAKQYDHFKKLDGGLTPQARGQRFNHLVADTLKAYGIDARPSVRRQQGEIDVVFRLNGIRYIMEVKWEKDRINEEPVGKLIRRVQQSLQGTQGILLSMSGFTSEAVTGAGFRERLTIVLMDASHYEALLTGVMIPEEVFDGLTDFASFHGAPTATIAELMRASALDRDPIEVSFDTTECPTLPSTGDYAIQRVLCQFDARQSGISADHQTGDLLVTTGKGVVRVRESSRTSEWVIQSEWCQNTAWSLNDGRVAVVRRAGVMAVGPDGAVEVVGGGFEGNPKLFQGPDGCLWACENGSPFSAGTYPVVLSRLGVSPGTELVRNIGGTVADAGSPVGVVTDTQTIYLVSQSTICRLELEEEEALRVLTLKPAPLINPGGLAVVAGRLYGIGDPSTIFEFDRGTLEEKSTLPLALGGSVYHLASEESALLLSAPCRHGSENPHQAIVRIKPRELKDEVVLNGNDVGFQTA